MTKSQPNDRVSIIVACRNEEQNLPTLFRSLASLSYAPEWLELIFVDDHSTDDSMALAEKLSKNLPYQSQIAGSKSHSGKKAALAVGVSLAKGDHLLFTDADCTFEPDWVQGMMGQMSERTKMVCGPVIYPDGKGFFSRWVQLEFVGLVASGAALIQKGYPVLANGANLAIQKDTYFELLGKVEGKGHVSGDDIFLLHALQKQKPGSISFSFDQRALVTTVAPVSIRAFFNQRIRWASKSKQYKSSAAIGLSLFILVFHSFLILAPFIPFFDMRMKFLLALGWFFKLIADVSFFKRTMPFFGIQRNVLELVLSSIIHTIYIVVVGWWSFIGSFKWKE